MPLLGIEARGMALSSEIRPTENSLGSDTDLPTDLIGSVTFLLMVSFVLLIT